MASAKRPAPKNKPSPKKKPTPKATSKRKVNKPSPKKKIVGGKGKMNGKETGTPFTKDNQPTSEARSKGQIRRFRGQELARFMLNQPYRAMTGDGDVLPIVAAFLGIPAAEVTFEQVMLFRQGQKAMTMQDTQAFNAVTDRAFGKPKEFHEILEVELESEEVLDNRKMKAVREALNEKF